MFDNHHGAAHVSAYVPAPLEIQRALVAALGVAIILDTGPDWEEVARLVRAGYQYLSVPKLSSRRRRR